MKKHGVMVLAVLGLMTTSSALLVLNVNPNQDGDWVLHLTGQHNGIGIVFYDDWVNESQWNLEQGGSKLTYKTDSIEEIFFAGAVNLSIWDAFDVGDGKVVGGTFFKGIFVNDFALILKLDPSFGTSISDFTSTVFDDTLVLKPSDKSSFSTVWNEGTYTDGDFQMNVSNTVIPEPATASLLAFICAIGFMIRRHFLS